MTNVRWVMYPIQRSIQWHSSCWVESSKKLKLKMTNVRWVMTHVPNSKIHSTTQLLLSGKKDYYYYAVFLVLVLTKLGLSTHMWQSHGFSTHMYLQTSDNTQGSYKQFCQLSYHYYHNLKNSFLVGYIRHGCVWLLDASGFPNHGLQATAPLFMPNSKSSLQSAKSLGVWDIKPGISMPQLLYLGIEAYRINLGFSY